MSLPQLAGQIDLISKRATATPVLLTPAYLSLQPPFFVALAAELAVRDRRQICFDWYRGMPGVLSCLTDCLAARNAARINRALTAKLQPSGVVARLEMTAAIGRPSSLSSPAAPCLIGISADWQELPTWTAPIRLAASPGHPGHLQSSQLFGVS